MDGGDTWVHLPDCGPDPLHQDIHDVRIAVGPQTKIYASCPAGVFASTDEGESWEIHEFPLFHPDDMLSYCRGMELKADDPNVVFVGNGDSTPGFEGVIQRSQDGGKTWSPVQMSKQPNSNIYWMASHPTDPSRIVANSINGYIYVSDDGGGSWEKVKNGVRGGPVHRLDAELARHAPREATAGLVPPHPPDRRSPGHKAGALHISLYLL